MFFLPGRFWTMILLACLWTVQPANAQQTIMVDSRITRCVRTVIPSILSGEGIPASYIEIHSFGITALGGGWRALANAPPDQVVREMEVAIKAAVNRGVKDARSGIIDVAIGFTKAPINKGGGVYAVSGVATATGVSLFAGSYKFTARVVIDASAQCRLRALTVAVLSSDAFDLGHWIRIQPEIKAVLVKYNLD